MLFIQTVSRPLPLFPSARLRLNVLNARETLNTKFDIGDSVHRWYVRTGRIRALLLTESQYRKPRRLLVRFRVRFSSIVECTCLEKFLSVLILGHPCHINVHQKGDTRRLCPLVRRILKMSPATR